MVIILKMGVPKINRTETFVGGKGVSIYMYVEQTKYVNRQTKAKANYCKYQDKRQTRTKDRQR